MTRFKLKTGFFLLILFGLVNFPVSVQTCAQGKTLSAESADNQDIPSGCSVITIARDGNIFFGGNDDYINPDSYYWVEPGDSTKYGVIWIGTPDNPQQGVNEKLLAYDANGLPRVDVNPHTETGRRRIPDIYKFQCGKSFQWLWISLLAV